MSIGIMIRHFADAGEARAWLRDAPAGALIEYFRGPCLDNSPITKAFVQAARAPESRIALFQKPIGEGSGDGRIFSYRCMVLTDGVRRALQDMQEATAAIDPLPSSVARVAAERRHLVEPPAMPPPADDVA